MEWEWINAAYEQPSYGKKVQVTFAFEDGKRFGGIGKRTHTDEFGDHYEVQGYNNITKLTVIYWCEIQFKVEDLF